MDFEILEEYDEDYDRASIRVTSPLQSDIGADFELFLGDCFRDPLLSFLGIERFSWDSSHWLKAAVWLSAEIAAWRHLDRDKGLYAKMVAKTESYRDRDATLAEFNALKRSAADPNISLRKRLQLLERAALDKEREVFPAGREQAPVYMEAIGRIAATFGQFDRFEVLQPPPEDALDSDRGVEFVSSYGAVWVALDNAFGLGLQPAGSRGTKSIFVPEHGLVRLHAGFLFEDGVLKPSYFYHSRVGRYEGDRQLPDDLVLGLAFDISSQFLASRPDVVSRLTAAQEASEKAIQWAKEVLPARLDLWLRAEARQSLQGKAIPVTMGHRELWVSPKLEAGRYCVRFRDPSAPRPYRSRYEDYIGDVVDLGGGQFGICHWHMDGETMNSRSYSPENAETDRLRTLAIDAVRAVIESGHLSPLENGSFDDFSVWSAHDFNFWTADHLNKNLALLGMADTFNGIQQRLRSIGLAELFGPAGVPFYGTPTLDDGSNGAERPDPST